MEAMRYTKNFVPWKHNLAKPLNGTTAANCMLKDFNHVLFRGASYDTRPPCHSTCFLWDSLDARRHYANTKILNVLTTPGLRTSVFVIRRTVVQVNSHLPNRATDLMCHFLNPKLNG